MSEPGSTTTTPGARGPMGPTPASFDVIAEVRRARVREDARDLFDLALLLAVNLLFLFWEAAQIPFVGRDISMALLLLLDAGYVVSWLVSRVIPLVKARRIASSWSEIERRRLRF